VEYEPPMVLGATSSGPEPLDNLSDKGDLQVHCSFRGKALKQRCMAYKKSSLRTHLLCFSLWCSCAPEAKLHVAC
jgi:hypothetical protein